MKGKQLSLFEPQNQESKKEEEHDLKGHSRVRLENFENCATAINHLFSEALENKPSDAFDRFFNFVCKFNNLSIYNAMLVMVQRPGASAVGTIDQWRAIGRTIKPDAVPIVVLLPFGPVRFVYELGDTAGDPVPGEKDGSLFAKGVRVEGLWEKAEKSAQKYNIEIIISNQEGMYRAGSAAGFTDYPEKTPKRGYRIKLNGRHDLPTQFATLAHELGHIYCGHLGVNHEGRWPNRWKISVPVKELEAEAVSYLVCRRNGIITSSEDYLRSIIPKAHKEEVSMYAIFDAANRVEARTDIKRPR